MTDGRERVLTKIGYRNANVSTILHTAAQHERWACEGCTPVFEWTLSEPQCYCGQPLNGEHPWGEVHPS